MRALPILLGLLVLPGCGTAPVYSGVKRVVIHHQTADGTSRRDLKGDDLKSAISCLASTSEISAEEASENYLSTIYLLQVVDRNGDRMFEIYTESNMKGNKGKHYANSCIYKIVRGVR